MNKRLVILVLLLMFFVRVWGQEELLLSLKQAENLAIQHNFQIQAALHRLDQGYYAYKASKGEFLPKLKFSSNAEIGKEQHHDRYQLDSVIMITQPLYDKVAIYQLKETQIQWESLRLEVQQQICEILFQVRESYYRVLLNQAHLSVDQTVIQLWEQEIKNQKHQLELGASIPYEVNQAQLHLKESWIDYYTTQSEIRSNQLKLLTLLGVSPSVLIRLSEEEIQLPSMDDQNQVEPWKNWASLYCPELKQKQFSFLLSQLKVNQTKAEDSPKLSLYASAGDHYINQGFGRQPALGVGLNLDWTLYNPSNQQKIKQAKEGIKEALSNYYQLELEIESSISNLLNEMEYFHFSYLAAQEGALLAQEGIRIATKKHLLGMMSSFEYREAIKSLHEAKQKVNQAKFDIRHTYDQLVRLVGKDLEVKKRIQNF